MVSPPFTLNVNAPADTDITSIFPALDRSDKATILAWLGVQWNDYGHTLADYYDGVGSTNGLVSDPSQPASGTAVIFRNSVGEMAIIDGETGTIQALGVPPGVILDFGGATAPNGYLLCYGQQVSQTTYANLYAVWETHGALRQGEISSCQTCEAAQPLASIIWVGLLRDAFL